MVKSRHPIAARPLMRVHESGRVRFRTPVPGRAGVCLIALIGALVGPIPAKADRPTCLYVSSYHQGFAWSDAIETALREGIGSRCEIVQYDMDTKRRDDPDDIRRSAEKALDLVARLRPDVLVISDDNAARHVVAPHLTGGDLPIVFTGLNWTVEEYGFPAGNVTGIVEVEPIEALIEHVVTMLGTGARGAFVHESTYSERKNLQRFVDVAEAAGLSMTGLAANDFESWQTRYREAQAFDFVLLGTQATISDWNDADASVFVREAGGVPSFALIDWMTDYVHVGFTKVSGEHGLWAAQAVHHILDGTSPGDIPLATNRLWDTWVNETLIEHHGLTVSDTIRRRAKRTQ